MLVSMKDMCLQAREGGYGIPALGINNEHNIRAAIECAEEKQSPVILLVNYFAHPDIVYFGNEIREIADKASVPVASILDHGANMEQAMWAIKAGLTDIMLDKSSLPYEENARALKEIVELAHYVGINVEGELGHVGKGDNYEHDGHTAFTVPEEAVRYVEETGVDFLAVAVGTAHGVYTGTPEIQFDLLKELHDCVDVPLVLHGGSGTGDENIAKACQMGICKVNIANDLYRGTADALINADISGNGVYGIYQHLTEGYKEIARHYMDVCGSTGKAPCAQGPALGRSEDTDVAEA